MRIWHYKLISVLPRKQLVSQWRELIAIKGAIEKNGTPNHSLVNIVLDYSIEDFKAYTTLIYAELLRRYFRAKLEKYTEIINWENNNFNNTKIRNEEEVYINWHNDRYLKQCLYNLQEKYDRRMITSNEWLKITAKFGDYIER